MKVTFVKPNIGRMEHSLYVDHGRMEPLMLGILAALTPPDIEVCLYDDRMETVPFDEQTDLVAITVETFTARRAYEIADEYKKRGVPVVMGGMHATLIPEEVQKHCDSVFIGDAETLWAEVVADALRGQLKKFYSAPPGTGQTGGIKPRRDLFEGKGYLPVSLLQYSRGCSYSCSFCAVSSYFNRKHYIRRVDEVVEEIEAQERRLLFFVDDNIACDHNALKELCRELVPLKINWVSQAGIDVTHDGELLKLMAESGCIGNVIGFESIVPESLQSAGKSANLRNFNCYTEELKALRDHSMQTWAAFTLGYDTDTVDSIMATMDFALKNRFMFAAFNVLMPYPGTELYRKLQMKNRLLYHGKWWLHPEYRFNSAAFVPAGMTADELTDTCHRARKKFNSVPSMLYRFSDIRSNLKLLSWTAMFWKYTTLFRKEVYRKHSMRFGLKDGS